MVEFHSCKMWRILCFFVIILISMKPHEASVIADYVVTEQCSAGNFPSDLGNEEVDRSKAYVFPGHLLTCEGQIRIWQFYASTTGKFYMCVLRPETNDQLKLIGCNKITANATGMQSFSVPESERLTVRYDDIMAIKWDNPADPQVLSIYPSQIQDKTPCLVLPVQNLTESELHKQWEYFWQKEYTAILWTISVRASVFGVGNILRFATDSDHMDENIKLARDNVWGPLCDLWEKSGAKISDVLDIMGKYIDWGEKQNERLMEVLKEIQEFCEKRKNPK